MPKKKVYDNDSISSLKGADRVRKRPGVIFGSDGLEGCEHAVFEILSNAIDEARAGFGRLLREKFPSVRLGVVFVFRQIRRKNRFHDRIPLSSLFPIVPCARHVVNPFIASAHF